MWSNTQFFALRRASDWPASWGRALRWSLKSFRSKFAATARPWWPRWAYWAPCWPTSWRRQPTGRAPICLAGGLGFALLLLRYSVSESGMFKKVTEKPVLRGHFLSLFANRQKFAAYLRCILIGLPIWFVIGILITFSPEFGKQLGVSE